MWSLVQGTFEMSSSYSSLIASVFVEKAGMRYRVSGKVHEVDGDLIVKWWKDSVDVYDENFEEILPVLPVSAMEPFKEWVKTSTQKLYDLQERYFKAIEGIKEQIVHLEEASTMSDLKILAIHRYLSQ